MAGMIPIFEGEAAGDITTGANINLGGTASQRAVDDRVRLRVSAEIAADGTVAAAAAAAVVNAAAAGNLMATTKGLLQTGLSVNNLARREDAGTYRLAGGAVHAGLPVASPSETSMLRVDVTDLGNAATQWFTDSTSAWWREAVSVVQGDVTWGPWHQVASTAEVPAPAASQALLDLASADGWLGVYDPTNWKQRTVVAGGQIRRVGDGLGNLPALDQPSNTVPLLTPGQFGQFDAINFGDTFASSLSTALFSEPIDQPVFILAMVQSRISSGGGRSRHWLDGVSSNRLAAIMVAADGYQLLAGGSAKSIRNRPSDTDPHMFGLQFAGDDSRAFVDGEEYVLQPQSDSGFTNQLTAIRLGNRFSGVNEWIGWVGPVLIHRGIPSDEVRERMMRLMLSLSKKDGYKADSLKSTGVIRRRVSGEIEMSKNPDVPVIPASTLKLLTAYLVRQYIATEVQLDTPVTLRTSDGLAVSGSQSRVYDGDVITYRGLLQLLLQDSSNAAARVLARAIGDTLPGTGTGYDRFVARGQQLIQSWAWEGATYTDPSGLSQSSRCTPRQLAELMVRIDSDSLLIGMLGAASASVPVTGPRARTMTVPHVDVERVTPLVPELIAVKGGRIIGLTGTTVVLYRGSDGVKRVIVTMGANPVDAKYPDILELAAGTGGVVRSAPMMQADAATSKNLGDAGSLTRNVLDRLYAPPEQDTGQVNMNWPGLDLSGTGARVTVQRRGALVELLIAAASLPAGAVIVEAIPPGLRPPSFAYGTLRVRDRRVDVDVQVRANGTLELYGNDAGDVLRGTVSWLTSQQFPADLAS